MTKTEIVETFARMERREVDRRMASQMEGGRRLVQRRKAEAELTAAFDAYFHHDIVADLAAIVAPIPVPELIVPGREGGRWVGEYSDAWGDAR